MKSNYRQLGDFIRQVDERNKDLSVTKLNGVSINKKFIPSIANTVGTDMSNYKIVRTGQFAYGPVTSRNGNKVSIAYLEDDDCIISSSYTVFEVVNVKDLLPKYLMLWFSRPEFDRYARFKSHGSVREIFDWDELCKVELPVPSYEEQLKIVNEYEVITDRIALKERINQNLELQAQAIYHQYLMGRLPNGSLLPESQSEVTLDEFCNIFTGKKNANAAEPDGKYKFFTCAPDFLYINTYIYDGDAIIVSGNGAYTGRTRFYSGPFDLYQRTYACALKDNIPPDFIFTLYWFIKLELSKKIMGGTHGSAIPYIVMNDLAKYSFVYDKQVFTELSRIFKAITKVIQENENENEKLANIRDVSLPKLMSGELDVSNLDL